MLMTSMGLIMGAVPPVASIGADGEMRFTTDAAELIAGVRRLANGRPLKQHTPTQRF